jgi:hypothetical protein
MKRCPMCGIEKPLWAFSRNVSRRDGVQSYCTECRRDYLKKHYARNIAKYRAAATVRNEVRRAAIRRIIRQAKDRPCSDCGSRYPTYVMDFDHRDRKEQAIQHRARRVDWPHPGYRPTGGDQQVRRCVLQLPPREDTSASRSSWVARIRTWTSRSRADRATVTPRPNKASPDASSPGQPHLPKTDGLM